ncbi:hypothetical protein NE237_032246 [Protea cynaroides]|uniref:Uncharacterized protein n=1 Tax=Protea cynaroides TaxID=273540 RepID=A0A9Q0L2Y4_9MAGN|nr:hypothetical protein NE237_032246 [Protea cynaroides]
MKKRKVHPSPPVVSDHLAFLPATLLTLTVALSPEDKEVLAYLISCTGNSTDGRRNAQKTTSVGDRGGGDHPASFHCNCFRCYMSYWVRWDSSPNRQLIHEILDDFEDGLLQKQRANSRNRRERKKRGSHGYVKPFEDRSVVRHELDELEVVEVTGGAGSSDGDTDGGSNGEEEVEKGSVRRFVSFIGERIWGVWSP